MPAFMLPPKPKLSSPSKATFSTQLEEAFPALMLAVSDQKLRARGINFDIEEDDMGQFRIARYRLGGILGFLHSHLELGSGQVTVFVDMPGCVNASRKPLEFASELVDALNLSDVDQTWANPDLDGIFKERLKATNLTRLTAQTPLHQAARKIVSPYEPTVPRKSAFEQFLGGRVNKAPMRQPSASAKKAAAKKR